MDPRNLSAGSCLFHQEKSVEAGKKNVSFEEDGLSAVTKRQANIEETDLWLLKRHKL